MMDKKWLIEVGTGYASRLILKVLVGIGGSAMAVQEDPARQAALALVTLLVLVVECLASRYAHGKDMKGIVEVK